jgi:predicted RecA/RadA family phage recombinase
MKTFVQPGDVLDLDAGATVASGTGHLFGAALFGVATVDAISGTPSSFIVRGVVTIAKTSALAIVVGDRLFWDATNSVVNKTTTAQQQVGIAIEAAANPSATVKMLMMPAVPVAT